VLLVLAAIFKGLPSRPLVVAAVVCLVLAALESRRDLRRQVRGFFEQQRVAALIAVVLVVGLAGFWALLPSVERYKVLSQLEMFSTEGAQIRDELALRGGSNQLMGDFTARTQDWHLRVETWVSQELGPFYVQRLGTPTNPAYPPQLPTRLRVFWDRLDMHLAAMETFRTELSRWLF